jgi:hypothetical protein
MLTNGDKVKLTIIGTWADGEVKTPMNTWFKLYGSQDPDVTIEKVEDNA